MEDMNKILFDKAENDALQNTLKEQKVEFQNLINNRISRLDDKDNSKFKFTIKQYDLTGYLIHILMKVSEILYLSVC